MATLQSTAVLIALVMFVDDIPVRGFIGRLEEGNFIPHVHKVLFFTHHVFNLEYNEDQVDSLSFVFIKYSGSIIR